MPSASPSPLLRATRVSRRHRGVNALDGVDVSLHPGTCLALLGSNGAGKTTLLEVLAGVLEPSGGTVAWDGGDGGGVGWVPQRPAVYLRLTVRENLRLFAGLEGAHDPAGAADDLVRRADLVDVADRQAGRLSTGTLQRLNIAVALAGRPVALLLDEPTATLSPDQRVRLWEWVGELRDGTGMAVMFSTQSVHEAATRAERLLVLDGGRTVFDGDAAGLVGTYGRDEDGADREQRAFMRLVRGGE